MTRNKTKWVVFLHYLSFCFDILIADIDEHVQPKHGIMATHLTFLQCLFEELGASPSKAHPPCFSTFPLLVIFPQKRTWYVARSLPPSPPQTFQLKTKQWMNRGRVGEVRWTKENPFKKIRNIHKWTRLENTHARRLIIVCQMGIASGRLRYFCLQAFGRRAASQNGPI